MTLRFNRFDHRKDLANQRELFKLCFPEAAGTSSESSEHYHWKFHSFPNDVHSYEFIAEEGGILAGYYAALPFKYMIDGRILTSGMVCDVMTHPGMRGKGIFKALGEFSTSELKKEGIHFTTGYPIRPEVIPGHLKVGWKVAFELPVYIGLLKSNSILKSKGLGFLVPIVNAGLSFIHKALDLFRKKNSSLTVERIPVQEFSKIATEYNDFLKKWAGSQHYYLIKDIQFLNWRLGAPNLNYEIVCLRDKKEIVALAITRRVNLKGIESLALLDIMCLDRYLSRIGILFQELKRISIDSGAEAIATMISPYWAKKYQLLRYGLIKSPAIFKFITKPLNLGISEEQFLKEENWHLMWIDSDDL